VKGGRKGGREGGRKGGREEGGEGEGELDRPWQIMPVLLANIIVELGESTVYSLHWHLSNIQNNYSSKN